MTKLSKNRRFTGTRRWSLSHEHRNNIWLSGLWGHIAWQLGRFAYQVQNMYCSLLKNWQCPHPPPKLEKQGIEEVEGNRLDCCSRYSFPKYSLRLRSELSAASCLTVSVQLWCCPLIAFHHCIYSATVCSAKRAQSDMRCECHFWLSWKLVIVFAHVI